MVPSNQGARILSLDIETAPLKATLWGMWQELNNIDAIQEDWFILSYSAKWLGDPDPLYDSLVEYPAYYKKNPECDKQILLSLRDLLDEADIVIAHNGKKFDIKKINARFLKYGILPPSPFRMIDTLRVAKAHFALTSNKLDYIARYLGLGRKIDTGGLDLWLRCMAGDLKAWALMVEYNIQDVILLEKVYLKLLPWISNHPNLAVYRSSALASCPKCSSTNLQWRGYVFTAVGRYRRFQCNDCGGWGKERVNSLPVDARKGVMANAVSNN